MPNLWLNLSHEGVFFDIYLRGYPLLHMNWYPQGKEREREREKKRKTKRRRGYTRAFRPVIIPMKKENYHTQGLLETGGESGVGFTEEMPRRLPNSQSYYCHDLLRFAETSFTIPFSEGSLKDVLAQAINNLKYRSRKVAVLSKQMVLWIQVMFRWIGIRQGEHQGLAP